MFGVLKNWDDVRSCGHVEVGKQIFFVHAKAFDRISRRPQVGDTLIIDEIEKSPVGIDVVRCSIEGVSL